MKNFYIAILLLASGIVNKGYSQVLRSMTARYTNSSVKGNITFVSNNIISSSSANTGEAPPAGTGVNNGNTAINIDIDGASPNTFFTYVDSWKYLDNNTRPANWETSGFADGSWASGPGLFGYGDGDVVTCVASGGGGTLCNPTGTVYTTTYFRKAITITDPTIFYDFTMNIYRDDGIVVYVNGTEVLRDNMPGGPIAHGTFASTCAADGGDAINTFSIPSSAFVAGTNVIAVEVHQCAAVSGDLVFGMELIGKPPGNTKMFPYGSNWKYLANNTRPAGWETVGFADGAWPNGNGEFGYGDGDETTCVPSGGGGTLCNPTGVKFISTYFRKLINIPNPALFSSFTLNMHRDDGIVVYVNGAEVFRNNLPAGPIVHGTLAVVASPDDGNATLTVNLATTLFVAGNNTIAVEIHQDNATSSDISFDMEMIGEPITETSFIPFASNWKYLDNNTRPAGWETPPYNDAAWAAGNGQFGYGDGDENTVVNYGPDPNNKYVTTYFRKQITIPNVSLFAGFIINLIRDDGAVVYVNGTEVIRNNLPTGAIAHGTFALAAISGVDESNPISYYLPTTAFVNGVNTIAVEMHQNNLTSTDLSFDLELLGTTDETFNSSSADLNLPSCSGVLFAGLYWGATQGTDGTNISWINNETNVKLMVPGSSVYQTVTSSQTDYHNGTLVPGLPHTGYRCFADITSLVNASSPNGTYVVGNVASPAGIINGAGGWTIVIAYSDPLTIVRNLTVFDGSIIMNGGDPALHVPISGFLTPPSGPVSCELGAVVYDGDRVSTDEYSFKQDSNPMVGTYTNLTPNLTANLNDMWNSTISKYGSVVTTRNPAHQNTLGYDADILTVPNVGNTVLGNSQTSASIRFSSPSENYMLQVATTAISQYTPTFRLRKTATDLNGGSLAPGDVVRYQIDFQNLGNDASVATVVYDNIPNGTTYVPNSLVINSVSKTDILADDEADYDFTNNRVIFRLGTGADGTNGGEVPSGNSGSVTFEVYTPSSCVVFSCNNTIRNRARIDYGGKLSGINLFDSSGIDVSGCLTPSPVTNTISGSCRPLGDTILTNICPTTSVTIPIARYAGYRFYTGFPFNGGNLYNPSLPVTTTQIIYAHYDGPGSCDDTIRLNIFIMACPDIDDDNDGIPDYVELDNIVALQDADSDGTPNWNDNSYPGFVDYNSDGFNDNFDPSADADNDGEPNFYDADFPGWVDSNSDGVNDNMDKDLDGIPNHLDLDSDNDGIPDVVESFGVDVDGDGRIDNYSDTDNDGFSQNVDGNNSGVAGSGLGLGRVDIDGDGIANYLDLDSDNDGIPDIIEAGGTDAANSARVSAFSDSDADGYDDALDADVGNDYTSENSPASLLKTGTDGNNDGRCDSWPNKNIDGDSKPDLYDLDSDGDGITDVKEAQFTDADWNGSVDGGVNSDGRNAALASLPALTLPDTDGTGRVNPFDIDSDDDGIPDNVEGLTTLGYLLPSGTDSDADGIDNSYDNAVGFGGDGIHPVDTESDGTPDYLDSDTDNDGLIDRIEGNDFNLNGMPDDNVTLMGVDTDGDGLDDRFDANNSSVEGTSAYMGNGGTFSGDATPGSLTMVQRTPIAFGCPTERDWRCLPYVLSCEFITFKGNLQQKTVQLDWTALCRQEIEYFIVERSIDGTIFTQAFTTPGSPVLNEVQSYNGTDNIEGISADILYYRLKSVMKSGRIIVSNVISVRKGQGTGLSMKLVPNPVRNQLQLQVTSEKQGLAEIVILDATGRIVLKEKENINKGSNTISYFQVSRFAEGVYYIKLQINGEVMLEKFNKLK